MERSGRVNAKRSVIVLGAGIQGICVALALHRAGWHVELIDRGRAPMLATSLRGEGKLHLGYVYGNEPERKTADLMVDAALEFSELIDQWLPQPIDWKAIRSEPFVYAILADSMVPTDRLAEHYWWVDQSIIERIRTGASYAGAKSFSPTAQVGPTSLGFSGDVVAAFQTSEIAVHPHQLRSLLLAGLESCSIACLSGWVVRSVEHTSQGFAVTATSGAGQTMTKLADAVVNCLWDGRLAIDATMGIESPRTCFYRLKYTVLGTIKSQLAISPTTTFALGPFGDVVFWPNGKVYLSWYPACLAGVSTDLEPPSTWRSSIEGIETTASEWEIASATVAALAGRINALNDLHVDLVKAGVVVAWGNSDIDQADSELHQRHAIGVHDHDGYLSVDTGKFTTAPLFAKRVVEILDR